jgi:membrane protease YdiL (CAAX protease family)
MDFTIKKPTHILTFSSIFLTFFIFIIFPILSFFGFTLSSINYPIGNFSSFFKIIFEIILLLIQLTLVLILFVLFPIIWYLNINGFNLKKFFLHLKLKKENINNGILWGIITVVISFILIAIIGLLFQLFGFDLTDSSNIPQLEQFFSVPSILILIIIQPVGEEIFFRGFLLDKLNNLFGKYAAIIITSLLFGIAHLSSGNIYPAILTSIIGLLLVLLVIKTDNLYSAIIAHILFNVISYGLFIIGKSLQILPLIL